MTDAVHDTKHDVAYTLVEDTLYGCCTQCRRVVVSCSVNDWVAAAAQELLPDAYRHLREDSTVSPQPEPWIAPQALRDALDARYGKRRARNELSGLAWKRWVRDLRECVYTFPPVNAAWQAWRNLQETHPRLRGDDWESGYAIGSEDEDLLDDASLWDSDDA